MTLWIKHIAVIMKDDIAIHTNRDDHDMTNVN